MKLKRRTNKTKSFRRLNFIKTQNLGFAKAYLKRKESQAVAWEKALTSLILDRELVSRKHKEVNR